MNTRMLVALVMSIVVAGSTALAEQRCVAGACFTPRVTIGETELPLRGAALFEYYSFDVYSGAFYAEPTVSSIEAALEPRPKKLILHYHRSLTKENFIESSEAMLKDNPQVDVERIRDELNMLYAMYTNVKAGDRYSLVYLPGKGTTLLLNDVPQGTIPGEEFQRAYFSIWISDYSVSKKFSERLVGL